jgi:alpha-1,2-glucosyltransferase
MVLPVSRCRLVLVVSGLFLFNFIITGLISSFIPRPYMDEVFHIPQSIEFIDALREWRRPVWDPSITTFPGLYFVSIPLITPLISGIGGPLDVVVLRCVNSVFMCFALFGVSLRLTRDLRKSVLIFFFPFLFFYSFLYYTDIASTVSVLTMVLLHVDGRVPLSGVVGGVAVLMRQTNIIWVFGLALDRLMETRSLRSLWSHILVGAAFVLFLVWNDFGIVLGHHAHHSVSLHLAQLNYFVFFTFAFSGPSDWISALRASRLSGKVLLGTIVFSCFAYCGTVVHPFILADNRHYTFYIYKRLIEKPAIRLLLIPCICSLAYNSSPLFKSPVVGMKRKWIFWLCTFMNLVPSPLIEFRYFIIPAVLLLHSRQWNESNWFDLIFHSIVNIVVLYIFLFKPFIGSDGSISRFMY